MPARNPTFTRRECLASLSWGSAALAAPAPSAPAVALAQCRTYGVELEPTLARMFDQLGGLGGLVKGQTVAIKVNMGGFPDRRLGTRPIGCSDWVHQNTIGAVVHLLGRAGARRIRLLEGPWNSAEPLEERMLQAGWEPLDILNAAARVECENTNFLGQGKKYSRFRTPHGGLIFPGFDLNHSYEECDVFVSLAKMKEHRTAGITLSMKNCFGITPCTIYGDRAGFDEPSQLPEGGREAVCHNGARQPSRSAPAEKDPSTPRDDGYRVPRIVADLVATRPVHLAIIDGIESIAGGEGPDGNARPVSPGLLVAGLNCVATDAVAMAAMGFDPAADRGAAPFEHCDSTLRMGELLGVGTRDLRKIDLRGDPLKKVRFDFKVGRRAL